MILHHQFSKLLSPPLPPPRPLAPIPIEKRSATTIDQTTTADCATDKFTSAACKTLKATAIATAKIKTRGKRCKIKAQRPSVSELFVIYFERCARPVRSHAGNPAKHSAHIRSDAITHN